MVLENGMVMMTEEEYLSLLSKADPYNYLINKATESCKYHTFEEALSAVQGERTIRKMAEDTGITASYISGMKKGKFTPSLQILKKMVASKSKPRGGVTLFELIMLCE